MSFQVPKQLLGSNEAILELESHGLGGRQE